MKYPKAISAASVDTRRAYFALYSEDGREIARLSRSEEGALSTSFNLDQIHKIATQMEDMSSDHNGSVAGLGIGRFSLPWQVAYLLSSIWQDGVKYGRGR